MMQWFLDNWKLLAFILNLTIAAMLWALSKTFAKKDDVSEAIKRIDKIEYELKELPSGNDIHHLEKQVVALKSQIDGLGRLLARVSNQLDMLVENELKGSN